MTKIKVTQGLAELKLLDARIKKQTGEFVGHITAPTGTDTTQFKTNAKSNFKSIQDLIQRRRKIKAAIVLSNAATTVTVGSENYTVAEAIELKNSISYDQELLKKIVTNLTQCETKLEADAKVIEQKVTDAFKLMAGKESKVEEEAFEAIRKEFSKNKLEIVEGVTVDDIKKLVENIDTFLLNVDTALQVSNAITEIEIKE